ncbi:farnesyl-diphosphate synthase [Thermoclostridium stercorarium subsp. thermolacticum DSM 2910]|jgi:geranylgeranyl diphosphate synthase type II|uniref:Farnesyl diphosphate synthase n=2 Tax=Thermoclostridium stercorarium TaxID=1510 RepID=A0A1B1YMV3_THEST|nr:farnesyl diphosphate synthase [Thermoclostridium stercorarium]ANW99485.1 farnesyl-diphosphate synthase [Thermoclostridium stercorarium subsp. thermolacticum DSM 2910]ANX02111.1 farnesyl-diphosphate synthase [Thermoclostridium stercorarium subsp. leptospartum DSM 9219]UZQ85176.1 polyprenyl synthetase family protein [Thermoclostridium stercorarium]
MNFKEEMRNLTALVDDSLVKYFDRLNREVPEKRLVESMSYSVMAGGKRIRPVLMLAVTKMLSGDPQEVMPFAAAIEMIHTYSLIHDDLPAMDNDDYRRGKLTNHKVFGEAMAILAGDALLNEAFSLLFEASANAGDKMEHWVKASCIIARAAGRDGMIAGQVIDMESEGTQVSATKLKTMHRKKTGALITASVIVPAVFLGLSEDKIKALTEYAENIGIAFQIRDDILDVEGTIEELGKPVGSDERNRKTTYVSLYGLDGAKEMLREVTRKAVESLDVFGERAWFLKEIAYYIAERRN